VNVFPIVVLIAGITANAAAPRADSASKLRERKVDVGEGASLRVVEAGQAAPGPTLVFVPGWSAGADIWRQQIDRFAPTYRAIACDPRSQGQSTITTSGNTPEMRAQDLHNLFKRLNARHPVLIGWSQGVQDLAAYIERYGTHDLAGLVFVDAAVCGWLGRNRRAPRRGSCAVQNVLALPSSPARISSRHDGGDH
jgi:non-heme chloroperoxidase